jgi:hypothetical protein
MAREILTASIGVKLSNLNPAELTEMSADPAMYFTAGYMAMVNSLLFYGREQALAIAAMVHQDLIADINASFDDATTTPPPDPPRVAIMFSVDHSLDLVKKALADAEAVVVEEPAP